MHRQADRLTDRHIHEDRHIHTDRHTHTHTQTKCSENVTASRFRGGVKNFDKLIANSWFDLCCKHPIRGWKLRIFFLVWTAYAMNISYYHYDFKNVNATLKSQLIVR